MRRATWERLLESGDAAGLARRAQELRKQRRALLRVLGFPWCTSAKLSLDAELQATSPPVIQCGTRVLVPLWDSLMFGLVLK